MGTLLPAGSAAFSGLAADESLLSSLQGLRAHKFHSSIVAQWHYNTRSKDTGEE